MRRAILVLLPLLWCGSLAVAQPVGQATNQTDDRGRKQGAWVKSWPNGKLRYQGTFRDDRPVGEFRHYDEEGKLTTVQEHAGDGRTSRARHFHTSGELMAAGKYVDRAKDSTWNYHAAGGALSKVENYRQGKLHGVQITYYPNGSKAEEEHYDNGELHGESRGWFANGNLRMAAHHVKGEPEGRMLFNFPSGKKEIEGSMVNGSREGAWFYYNEDGSVQLQVLYAKGEVVKEKKENGTFTEYYEDEQVKSETTYKKGFREGRFVEYYPNGRWEVKTVPPDPISGAPGDVERVLIGQTKKREGTYKGDKLDGEVKEYDEKGRVVKTRHYAAGIER